MPTATQDTLQIPGHSPIHFTKLPQQLRALPGGERIRLSSMRKVSVDLGPYIEQDLVIMGVAGATDEIDKSTRVIFAKMNGGSEKAQMCALIGVLRNSDAIIDAVCRALNF